jgi:hypothetical protein
MTLQIKSGKELTVCGKGFGMEHLPKIVYYNLLPLVI